MLGRLIWGGDQMGWVWVIRDQVQLTDVPRSSWLSGNIEECSRNWGSRGCSKVEAKQVPPVNICPTWIHCTKLPPLHACLCHPYPPPWLSLGSDLSSSRQWSSQVPRLFESPRVCIGWESQNSECLFCRVRAGTMLCSVICGMLSPMDTEVLGFYLCQQET